MRNVRLLVPDQLHAKMHQVCSLAGVSIADGYVILAAQAFDDRPEQKIVKILQEHSLYAHLEGAPAVVQEAGIWTGV